MKMARMFVFLAALERICNEYFYCTSSKDAIRNRDQASSKN
jgi:hypothetical protein